MVVRSAGWVRRSIDRGPGPDSTASDTYPSAYAEIIDWKKNVDDTLSNLAKQFDVPVDPKSTSEPTPDEQKLFAEILQRPNDADLRRRYAELAAKRQDPRAELIREQLAIRDLEARGEMILHGNHPARVQQLIVSHPEWTAALAQLGASDFKFDLGFPWSITIEVTPFLEHAEKLFALAPLESVRLRGGLAGRGRALRSSPRDRRPGAGPT